MLVSASGTYAAELVASDAAADDWLGKAVSQSGSTSLIGALFSDSTAINTGSAYLFRNIDTASGTVTQNVKLVASDAATNDRFGDSVSLFDDMALIAASFNDDSGTNSGSAYVFRSLDTGNGTVTQNVKLVASDASTDDRFGHSVSLSNSMALVGVPLKDDVGLSSGSAYIFRNLETASGTVTQDVKLVASDAANNDYFGWSVSLSDNTALVGAHIDRIESGVASGSAYVYRNLDTASSIATEDVKLIASDGVLNDYFGFSTSLSRSIALVGAWADDDAGIDSGSAYVFRDVDTASGTITEHVKLVASDAAADDRFGSSVSQSGHTALIGAWGDDGTNYISGSAYIFLNLDTASGTATENVKIIASDAFISGYFGSSVSISGDNLVIGALSNDSIEFNAGKAYTGTVSSVTTLDTGNVSGRIDGISFISQDHWIIGETTDANQVTLGAGDSGDVTAFGKSVFIGRNTNSDNNMLFVEGSLMATEVRIGSELGNSGNTLRIAAFSSFDVSVFYLAAGNYIYIEGNYTEANDLLAFLAESKILVENSNDLFEILSFENFDDKVETSFDGNFTTISVVPESSQFALIGGLVGFAIVSYRRRGV